MHRILAAGLALVLMVVTWSGCGGQEALADDVNIKSLLDDPGSRHGDFLIVRKGYLGRFMSQSDSCKLLGLFEDTGGKKELPITEKEVEALIEKRNEARAKKDWIAADIFKLCWTLPGSTLSPL